MASVLPLLVMCSADGKRHLQQYMILFCIGSQILIMLHVNILLVMLNGFAQNSEISRSLYSVMHLEPGHPLLCL